MEGAAHIPAQLEVVCRVRQSPGAESPWTDVARTSEPEENTYYKRENYQRPQGCQRGIYGASPPYDDVLWPRISHRGSRLCCSRVSVSERDSSSPSIGPVHELY